MLLRPARLLVLLALALCVVPLAVKAQESRARRSYRIGFLAMVPPAASEPFLAVFRQTLHEHGYVDGQHVTIERRGTGDPPRSIMYPENWTGD